MSTLAALRAVAGARTASAVSALPPDPGDSSSVPLLRLVNRTTFGFTHDEWALATSLGPLNYIEHRLADHGHADGEVDVALHGPGYETLSYTTEQLWNRYYSNGVFNSGPMIEAVVGATMLRAVKSRRQFFERMVEFWSDHFSIYLFADYCDFLKVWDDTNVVRRHAMGRFRDLLGASARSSAMLLYLNNATNVKQHPNENYGRELLELHTLGVDGGYTQADVQAVARCFTGWTVFPIGTPKNALAYHFDSTKHDASAKVLFVGTPQEVTIPGGYESQGNQVLDVLARHPSTARFISKKLLKRFWGENPTSDMIAQVAAVFTATDGDITSVMRAVLRMTLAVNTPRKYKRPFHLLASTLRALNASFDNWLLPAGLVYGAGHYPFLWPAPNGYPDAQAYWTSLQLPRWNLGSMLLDSRTPSPYVDVVSLMQGAHGTEGTLDRIGELFMGAGMTRQERAALRNVLGVSVANPPWQKVQDALAVASAMPSFQWY